MKEAYWGYWLILLGVFVVIILLLIQNVTSANTESSYAIRQINEAAMIDAVDYAYYREYGELKINKEKFMESFLRRFAETASLSTTYNIVFAGIYETPPKVSVEVSSKTNTFVVGNDATDFDIENRVEAILEQGSGANSGGVNTLNNNNSNNTTNSNTTNSNTANNNTNKNAPNNSASNNTPNNDTTNNNNTNNNVEPNPTIKTIGIKLNNNKMVMVPNEEKKLIATVTPSNATNKNVTWKSNNPAVATVNNGVVTAVAKGNTTIIATTNDGKKATCDITVDNDVYDVILFWGQSNMVGYAGSYKTSSCNVAKPGENCKDYRLTEKGSSNFSSLTGINSNILKYYSAVNHVNVPITPGTVYDYHSCSDTKDTICDDGKGHKGKGSLVEITSSTDRIGQNFYPKPQNNTVNFYSGVSTKNGSNYYSLMRSYGTNIIPWFSYQYYKNTGHKVVAVLGANGGEILNHFLPHGSQNGCENGACTSTNNQYLYESMVAKYDAAVKYLIDQNMTIGNKFHILFQGENDAKRVDGGVNTMDSNNNCIGSNGNYWKTYYEFIHKKLKQEHDLKFGVIIETAWTLNSATYCGVERIHNAQQNAINSNSDVILGSSYPYDHYLPTKTLFTKYYSTTYANGLYKNYKNKFNEALEKAKLSQSVSKYKSTENMIHFNSAALSQIGLETANNVNNYLKNNA